MDVVYRFEHRLLNLLRFFLRAYPVDQAVPLLIEPFEKPPCLCKTCVDLVEDHLAKGCSLILARSGGWRRERFMRGVKHADGRLWDRTEPKELGLQFSKNTLRFLIWITASNLKDKDCKKWGMTTSCAFGDYFFFYLVYTVCVGTPAKEKLVGLDGFRDNPLCLLAYPQDFQEQEVDFNLWVKDSVGSYILEALQKELADKWIATECSKKDLKVGSEMLGCGSRQTRVLNDYLLAIEKNNRRDLARFLFIASYRLLAGGVSFNDWVGEGIVISGRLADKVETYRAALALVIQVSRFQKWEQDARSVGYHDEEYQASQLMKEDWEKWGGGNVIKNTTSLLTHLDPLKQISQVK